MRFRFRISRLAVFLAGVAALCCTTAYGSPSNDPKFRTQVAGPNGTTWVLSRDPADPMIWYYVPASLRIAEDERGEPKFHWTEVVYGGRRHAIVQMALTGKPDSPTESLMREAAVRYFEARRAEDSATVVPTPEQIRLSPVGPLQVSQLRAVLFQNGVVEMVLSNGERLPATSATSDVRSSATSDARPTSSDATNAVESAAANVAQDAAVFGPESPPVPARKIQASATVTGGPTSMPGVTDLSSEAWIQYEIVGPGVEVVKNLLTGDGHGGLILLMAGEYRAYAPEVSVEVELNVEALQTFFRDRHEERSGWSFLGLFGSSKHSIRDHIESRTELKKNIRVRRIGGGELSASDWEKIESRLFNFVTKEVFSNSPADKANPGDGPAVVEGKLFDAGGVITALTGIPILSAPLGWHSANGNLNVRLNASAKKHAYAKWTGLQLERTPLLVHASVSLGKYDQEVRRKVIGKPVEVPELQSVFVSTPTCGDSSLNARWSSVDLAVSIPDGKDERVIGRLLFDSQLNRWRTAEATNENRNVFANQRGAVLVVSPGTPVNKAFVRATFTPQPLNGANGGGLPPFVLSRKAANGDIALGGDVIPFRGVTITAAPLLADGIAGRVALTLKVVAKDAQGRPTGGPGWANPVSIAFPIIDAEVPQYTGIATGQVQELVVHFDGSYADAFRGVTPLSSLSVSKTWLETERARINAGGSNLISIDGPSALGIRRYGVSLNRLRRQGAETVRLQVVSTEGREVVMNFALGEQVIDESTGRPVSEGVASFLTADSPRSLKGEVRFKDGSTRAVAMPGAVFDSWRVSHGMTLVIE